ncbi:MAG: DNA polymerase domain-containing protein [Bacteroidota bacterium]
MNPLLYGENPDERIVGIHPTDESSMRVYLRRGGHVEAEDSRFYPFFFLSDAALLAGFGRKCWVKKLAGDLYYRYVCAFEDWSHMWSAVRTIRRRPGAQTQPGHKGTPAPDPVYLVPDPVSQYLMQSGRTLFKGMEFEELHRLQVDIETYTTPPHSFSDPLRPGDRILLIALADNRGWEHVLDGALMEEPGMLRELQELIRQRDPDVLEGHNVLAFDLPYILQRCAHHGIPFAVGRDGSSPSPGPPFPEVRGRHLVDTLLLVQNHDASRRDMESYGLKYAARFFGVSEPDRAVIPGDRIARVWDQDPAAVRRYALHDVRETRRLADILSPPSFHATRMLPFTYEHTCRLGSAAKIEALLVREYLRAKHSMPHPAPEERITGGYSDIFRRGAAEPVVHADVESLYPAVMVSSGITPSSDALGVFGALLGELTGMRIQAKRRAEEAASAEERLPREAFQSSLKLLINSFYGYLGYARALFNDFGGAEAVTRTGREMLVRMIREAERLGGTVIQVDTDGLFCIPPPQVDTEAEQQAFAASLASVLPSGFRVALSGRYARMLSLRKKNYALLRYDGAVVIRGSALVSRSLEPFARDYLRECIECLLKGEMRRLHQTYLRYRGEIEGRTMDIRLLARTETLRDSPEEYAREVKEKTRSRSAPYEVALGSDRTPRRGSRVSYYMAGNDPDPVAFRWCRAVEEWNPSLRDESIPYYLRRLEEVSERFRPLLQPVHFKSIFSLEPVFQYTDEEVTLVSGACTERDADLQEPDLFGVTRGPDQA